MLAIDLDDHPVVPMNLGVIMGNKQWSIESVQADPQLSSTDDYFRCQCNGPPIW
jgi:hypothetical protein